MRIADWTPDRKRQPEDLVDAIVARRGGQLLNLDKALLWSEPVARGWNIFMRDVRNGLSTDRRLQELAICTVALVTGAIYEFHHHAPDFLAAGGEQRQLDALQRWIAGAMPEDGTDSDWTQVEWMVVQFATQITRDLQVSDSLFAEMREHFDETQIVEFTVAIAAYNMVARILKTLRIEPET